MMWRLFSRQPAVVQPAPPRGAAADERLTSTSIATIEWFSDTAVVTITVTELTLDQGLEELTSTCEELYHRRARHLVLDIQNVQYMDSACLRCLIETARRFAQTAGRIALVNPNHTVQYLIKLTRLGRMFPICNDVMAALTAVERTANPI